MWRANWTYSLMLALSCVGLVGCQNLPGSRGTQGAVIGGTGGAAVGALAGGENHRLLGAVIGGALGSAGGYIVGTHTGQDQNSAQRAAQYSQEHPATAQEAMNSNTADLNHDGFVTLDEIVAMKDAGLGIVPMLDRMRATGQVFDLTPSQRQYLLDRGVSPEVVQQIPGLNRNTQPQVLNPAVGAPAVGAPNGAYPSVNQVPQTAPPVVGQPPAVPSAPTY